MSQCFAEDQETAKRFATAIYTSPKFPEEPRIRVGIRGRLKKAVRIGVSSRARVVSDLRRQLDTTIFRLLVTAQSKEQFKELRNELFVQFVDLSSTIAALVPLPDGVDQNQVVEDVFAHLTDQLGADSWLLPRLKDASEEVKFCLDTLHRAHFLAEDVREGLKNGTLPQESRKGYADAISQEWWSILHLRCIIFAIRHKVRPSDEVLLSLLEGFRHSVMSYAHARQAIEPQICAKYASINISSLTPAEGDYAPDTVFGD